jgi:hypothetical protein
MAGEGWRTADRLSFEKQYDPDWSASVGMNRYDPGRWSAMVYDRSGDVQYLRTWSDTQLGSKPEAMAWADRMVAMKKGVA